MNNVGVQLFVLNAAVSICVDITIESVLLEHCQAWNVNVNNLIVVLKKNYRPKECI
jgi:hypothetical protein